MPPLSGAVTRTWGTRTLQLRGDIAWSFIAVNADIATFLAAMNPSSRQVRIGRWGGNGGFPLASNGLRLSWRTPLGWQHTVEFVVTVTMLVAQAPFSLPLYWGCCWFIRRQERMFVMFIVVQVLAGVWTTAASIFFWYISGEAMAILSSIFGLYSPLVGTVVAAKQASIEHHDYGARRARAL